MRLKIKLKYAQGIDERSECIINVQEFMYEQHVANIPIAIKDKRITHRESGLNRDVNELYRALIKLTSSTSAEYEYKDEPYAVNVSMNSKGKRITRRSSVLNWDASEVNSVEKFKAIFST